MGLSACQWAGITAQEPCRLRPCCPNWSAHNADFRSALEDIPRAAAAKTIRTVNSDGRAQDQRPRTSGPKRPRSRVAAASVAGGRRLARAPRSPYAVVRRTRRRGCAGRGTAVRAGWGRPPRGVACACCCRCAGGPRAAPLSHRQMRILSMGLVGWSRPDVWSAASGGADTESHVRDGRRRAPFSPTAATRCSDQKS